MATRSVITLIALSTASTTAFSGYHHPSPRRAFFMSETDVSDDMKLDPTVSAQFKILTCSSTSCAQKRKMCGLDPFATYGAFYSRIKDAKAPGVQLEESPCLGSCEKAPCVAIEHEDFVGYVGLEGMTDVELSESVFHRVITEADANRVWLCVENAIQLMTEEESEEDE